MPDFMPPVTDGVEPLRLTKGRADARDNPVIMATAKGRGYDKIRQPDLGASVTAALPKA